MKWRKIKADFETQSRVNLKKSGAYEYSVDESTKAVCLGFKEVGSKGVGLLTYHQLQKPWKTLPERFRAFWLGAIHGPYLFSAHNAFFEQVIYNNVLVKRFDWPKIPASRWRCTAAKAAACSLPRKLEEAGRVMNLRTQKDMEGHRVMMKLCKPTAAFVKWHKAKAKKRPSPADLKLLSKPCPPEFWTPETAPEDFEKLYHYCKIDVLAEEELDLALPDLNEFEQKLWVVDQKINMRGVTVDVPLVKKIHGIMTEERNTMAKELDVVTMGLVSSGSARQQILDFLKLEGVELPNLQAKTVEDFLAKGKMSDDAKELLRIRKALSKSSTAKYDAFLRGTVSDGRIRDILLYHGASTGRWGGKTIQPQNFPRGIIKDTEEAIRCIQECESADDLKLLYGSNLMPLFSSVLRGMFIASPGKELFVQDWNAIETRVLWWLAGHDAGLKIFSEGGDPYKDMAAYIFNKSPLEVTDDERQLGKAVVLGCGYQMGWKKFITSAWDVYRVKVTEDMSKIAVGAYRKRHWPVPKLWENYNNACIAAIENPTHTYRVGRVRFFCQKSFLWIELPGGKRIAYKDPKVVWESNAFGFSSKKVTYWAIDSYTKKWSEERTYGGKIVENVVQAVSRNLLAESIVRAEEHGFEVLMHSHDELVAERLKGAATSDDYRALMEVLPPWADGLPLKAGGWVGQRYRK